MPVDQNEREPSELPPEEGFIQNYTLQKAIADMIANETPEEVANATVYLGVTQDGLLLARALRIAELKKRYPNMRIFPRNI